MKNGFLMALVLIQGAWWAALARAQAIETKLSPTGDSMVVHNRALKPLVSHLIITDHLRTDGRVAARPFKFVDALVVRDPRISKELLPGAAVTVSIRFPTLPGTSPATRFAGGIFSDGESYGDPEAVRRLIGRRRSVLITLGKTNEILARGPREGKSVAVLTADLAILLAEMRKSGEIFNSGGIVSAAKQQLERYSKAPCCASRDPGASIMATYTKWQSELGDWFAAARITNTLGIGSGQ